MRRMLTPTYKVICCENEQKYPGQLFIDIAPAHLLTHEKIFFARQAICPRLTADDEMTGGIILMDLGKGDVKLCYETVCNYSLKRYQDHLRKRLDPLIRKLYKNMKKQGFEQTVSCSAMGAKELFSLSMCEKRLPVSAKEEKFMADVERAQKREKLLEIKREYYAQRQCAQTPHLLLAWKQALRDGD